MAHKVLIDTDPGIGDAVTIALALFDPNLDVVAITATPGCVSSQVATRNIQTVIDMTDPPKWPRLGGCALELPTVDGRRAAAVRAYTERNGPYGLGEIEFGVADLHSMKEADKVMIDIVRDQPNEVTILTLGPLTNIEIAAERAPEFLELLGGLVCLGGSIQEGGDVTATAEFNIFANPEAARHVLRSPATKTLVPLDVSTRMVLTFEQFDRLTTPPASPLAQFLQDLLPFAFRAHHEQLGLEGIRLPEVTALASIVEPRLFGRESMALDVETRGELTRGMTVFDRRGVEQWQTNIDVLTTVDAQGVLDYFTRTVRRAG